LSTIRYPVESTLLKVKFGSCHKERLKNMRHENFKGNKRFASIVCACEKKRRWNTRSCIVKVITLQVWTVSESNRRLKFPEFLDNRHMDVVNLSAQSTSRLYPLQETIQLRISVGGWVYTRAILQPEGLSRRKIPMTPSGIEPATFRLVAQCFNKMRHRVPQFW